MSAPFIATNRLGYILEMIALSKQSGLLRAARGAEPSREYGQILFVAGQVQSAVLGNLTADSAMMMLSHWGDCLYSFDEHADISGTFQSRRPTGALGGDGIGAFDQLARTQVNSGSLPRYAQSWPLDGEQGYTLTSDQVATEPPALGGSSWASGSHPVVSSAVLTIAPRRTPTGDQIDRLPLDRRERMVLMLVDGNRNVADLGRLTRLTDQDAYAVLVHLARLGCVELDAQTAY